VRGGDDGEGKKQMAQRTVNVKHTHTHTHTHTLLRGLLSDGRWIAWIWCIGEEANVWGGLRGFRDKGQIVKVTWCMVLIIIFRRF